MSKIDQETLRAKMQERIAQIWSNLTLAFNGAEHVSPSVFGNAIFWNIVFFNQNQKEVAIACAIDLLKSLFACPNWRTGD
jgi:hypothetical protein